MKKPYLALWALSVVSVAAGIPYAFELQSGVLEKATISFPLLVLISIVQTALLLAIAIYAGKKAAAGIGLKVFASKNEHPPRAGAIAKLGVAAGILVGVAIYVTDILLASTITPQLTVDTVRPAIWKTLLASFYGGVVEEVLLRLFLVTVLVWAGAKIWKMGEPAQSKAVMWCAIVISAIVFGLGHLPATAALTAITPAIVLRAVILNGIGGLVFGWLYWRKGLEYAIAAHFTADVVLLTLLPAIV